MKVIIVETDEMDRYGSRTVLEHRINPASISRIVEKRINGKVKDVCVVFTSGSSLDLSPSEWADRKVVDDPDPDVTSPDTASRPDGVIDTRNVTPNAPDCQSALRAIITACDIGLVRTSTELAEPYRGIVESHGRVLRSIRERAEEAYRYAGGRL